MTYTAIPHVNSNNSFRRRLVRRDSKTGELINHVTYQLVRAERRAIDIKRESRIQKRLSNAL